MNAVQARVVVGVSDMKVSGDPAEVLATFALGSCVGLTLYDPVARVGGLLHSMLPLSRIDPAKASLNPSMFVDTGVPALLQALFDRGAQRRHLVAKLAGASQVLDSGGVFNIGERNRIVLRKILWKNDILVSGEDVGGCAPRSLFLHIDSGKSVLRVGAMEREL